MAKYIAEIQDASGNTVYPATQWGAITNPPAIPEEPQVGGWTMESMRNGFIGNIQWRTVKYPKLGLTHVYIIGEAGKIKENVGKYMCDVPPAILPKNQMTVRWSQPKNDDFTKIGMTIGGAQTSIMCHYCTGGASNLVIELETDYWLD